jgi:hypothetical protein
VPDVSLLLGFSPLAYISSISDEWIEQALMRFPSAACLAVLLLIDRYQRQLGCGTSDCHLTKVTVSLDSVAFDHCVGETRVAGRCACCEFQCLKA